MNWKDLKGFIVDNTHVAISIPAIMSTMSFISHLVIALSDGQIDASEFQQLMASANGIETVALVLIMLALRGKKQ